MPDVGELNKGAETVSTNKIKTPHLTRPREAAASFLQRAANWVAPGAGAEPDAVEPLASKEAEPQALTFNDIINTGGIGRLIKFDAKSGNNSPLYDSARIIPLPRLKRGILKSDLHPAFVLVANGENGGFAATVRSKNDGSWRHGIRARLRSRDDLSMLSPDSTKELTDELARRIFSSPTEYTITNATFEKDQDAEAQEDLFRAYEAAQHIKKEEAKQAEEKRTKDLAGLRTNI